MKTETLEALLVDRALGALPPEAGELLEAHLACDPEAARQAAGMEETIRLARQAVALPRPLPAPPLSCAQLRGKLKARRRRALAWELSRLAAAVLFGLTLGWHARNGGAPSRAAALAPHAGPGRPAVVADHEKPLDSAGGFWALSRFLAAQQARPTAGGRRCGQSRLQWESPVKIPHLEEKL